MYVFCEDVQFYKLWKLPYKGQEYDIEKIYVVINGVQYKIIDSHYNKYEIKLLLKSMDRKILSMCEPKQTIDSKIDKIIPIVEEQKEIPVYDHPDAMGLGTGCLWYAIIMLVGLIFKDWFAIWTLASVIFWPWFLRKPRFKK